MLLSMQMFMAMLLLYFDKRTKQRRNDDFRPMAKPSYLTKT